MIIECDNQLFSIKFGTISLIILRDFLNMNSEEETRKVFTSAIVTDAGNNSLTKEEKEQIYNNFILRDSVKELLNSALEESLGDYKEITETEFEELYSIAVGEIGISPQEFYQMTPREVDLAYAGYVKRKELDCNCLLITLRKAKDSNANLISFLGGEGYSRSSLTERKNTFDALGI